MTIEARRGGAAVVRLREWFGPTFPYLPIFVAAITLLVPLYAHLSSYQWKTDDQGHGPFIIAAAIWLAWRQRDAARAIKKAPAPLIGWPLFLIGLVMFFIGKTQETYAVAAAAQLPIICGLVLLLFGTSMLRVFAFPLFFLIFSFPVPGWIIDTITVPLKGLIADMVVNMLYSAGYPIAQNGVIITIGPYALLVKDACSGLNSMFSLSAIGLFYIYLVKHTSQIHNGILLACILPVSFFANLVRVTILVLMTYYAGDVFTSGFFHDFAGVLLFTAALLSIFAVDGILLAFRHTIAKIRI
jgi:exosortase B